MSIEQVPEQKIGGQLRDIVLDLYTRWDPEYTYSIVISPEPLRARPTPVLTRIERLEAALATKVTQALAEAAQAAAEALAADASDKGVTKC